MGSVIHRIRRALVVLPCALALAACGPPQASDTPVPTPTPDPTATPPVIMPIETVRPQPSAPIVPDTPLPNHRHPVFTVTWTLSGATSGSATFTDDTTGAAKTSCAAASRPDPSGTWVLPSQHYSQLTIGGHGIGEGVELTASDSFTGPGTYRPGTAPIFVDSDRFSPSLSTALTLNADGSGSLSLATYADGSGATLDGTVTWTCSLSAG